MMALFSNIVIRKNSVVRKERTLPSPGEVLVRPGDIVGPSAVVAKTDFLRESPRVVDLNAELQQPIPPDMVQKVVLKQPGDYVHKGEVLAAFPNSMAGETIEVLSPCDGIVQYVSKLSGKIVMLEDPKSMQPMAIVNVSSILNINPRSLRAVARVKEGDYVTEGEIIAGSPTKGKLDIVYAPISGIVTRICPYAGTISIVRPMKTLKVRAQIPGRVIQTIEHTGAIIEGLGSTFEGVCGVGTECFGNLCVLAQNPYDVLDEAGVGNDVAGKILAAGAGATFGAIKRAFDLGARGIIAGGFNQRDIISFLGQEIDLQNTEIEGLDFALMMTEGAGFMPMSSMVWEILNEGNGLLTSVDGVTKFDLQIKRPWAFIDYSSRNGVHMNVHPVDPREESTHRLLTKRQLIAPGDLVRCLREPYFGLWGIVEDHITQKTPVESGEIMETIKVRLDDGRSVNVAETNVEVVVPV